MRVLLRDLAPGQQYAIRFRSNNGEEVSEWSQVQRFTTTNDTIAPSQVTNLSWYDSGPAFIGEWDRVTTQATVPPTELKDFKHYRCNVSDGIKVQDFFVLRERFELTREMNIATFGSLKTALTLKVYAVDLNYNESVVTQVSANPANPPVPSAATLSNHYGSVLLEWNGRDAGGQTMPANLDYVEIHVGTTVNFVADATTFRERLVMNRSSNTQRAILTGLTNGTQYYVRLIAVNVLSKKSAQSAVSNSITKSALTGIEIANGQITPAQINFTAREIGGANAYYSESQPQVGVNGVTILKAGDIWYDIDNAYTTYKHDGTTWVLDESIGVVHGRKILGGTVTADAVGTNLIIAKKANIKEAIIDSSHIDQLSANKITAGVLQSTFNVNYGGSLQPAWSLDVNGNMVINNAEVKGQIVLGNASNTMSNSSFQIKSYNYVAGVAGWTINGDGTVEFGSATMRGSFRTNTTGRRIEILSGGTSGTIRFIAPDGDQTYIRSLTESNQEGIEALQLGVGDMATAWNRAVINLGHGGHIVQRARIIEMVAGDNFRFFVSKTSGGLHTDAFNALGLDSGGWTFRDPNHTRMTIGTNGDWNYWHNNGFWRWGMSNDNTTIKAHHNDVFFTMRSHDGYTQLQTGTHGLREFFNNGEVRFDYAPQTGSVNFVAQGTWNASPSLTLFTGSGHGNKLFTYQDNRGVFFEMQGWNGGWAGLRAHDIYPQSDERLKENIVEIDSTDMLTQLRKTKVKKYSIKHQPQTRKRKLKAVTQALPGAELPTDRTLLEEVFEEESVPQNDPVMLVGLIAQEAPEQIVSVSDDRSFWGISLYQMASMIWASVQAVADKLDALDARVTKLEPKGQTKK